jgi:hypothetical protein
MLPIGSGRGELWNDNRFLCQVDYDISPPLSFVTAAQTQRIQMVVRDHEYEKLLDVAGLTLIVADGSRHCLPRSVHLREEGHLECFLSADV